MKIGGFFSTTNLEDFELSGITPILKAIIKKRSQSFKELITYLSHRYKSDIYGLQGEFDE